MGSDQAADLEAFTAALHTTQGPLGGYFKDNLGSGSGRSETGCAFLSQVLQIGNWSHGHWAYVSKGLHDWGLREHASHLVLMIIEQY